MSNPRKYLKKKERFTHSVIKIVLHSSPSISRVTLRRVGEIRSRSLGICGIHDAVTRYFIYSPELLARATSRLQLLVMALFLRLTRRDLQFSSLKNRFSKDFPGSAHKSRAQSSENISSISYSFAHVEFLKTKRNLVFFFQSFFGKTC